MEYIRRRYAAHKRELKMKEEEEEEEKKDGVCETNDWRRKRAGEREDNKEVQNEFNETFETEEKKEGEEEETKSEIGTDSSKIQSTYTSETSSSSTSSSSSSTSSSLSTYPRFDPVEDLKRLRFLQNRLHQIGPRKLSSNWHLQRSMSFLSSLFCY